MRYYSWLGFSVAGTVLAIAPVTSWHIIGGAAVGNRLSKIYTRTGDSGETGLGDGSRVAKDHQRVEAYGTVDELNSVVGMLLGHDLPDVCTRVLSDVQHHLFDLGGELCVPGHEVLTQDHVTWLEQELDAMNSDLPYLKEFILPGGSVAAGTCHLARTVCRRAERNVVTLARDTTLPAFSAAYLNRLSDLLFVMARVILVHQERGEVLWQSGREIQFKGGDA